MFITIWQRLGLARHHRVLMASTECQGFADPAALHFPTGYEPSTLPLSHEPSPVSPLILGQQLPAEAAQLAYKIASKRYNQTHHGGSLK